MFNTIISIPINPAINIGIQKVKSHIAINPPTVTGIRKTILVLLPLLSPLNLDTDTTLLQPSPPAWEA